MRRGHLPKEINNLRLGECLLLGRDMAFDVDIEGLSQDTMRLEAELVEVRAKRTLPVGEIGHDAFGNVPVFIAFGAKRYEIVLDEEGNASKKRVIDFVANLDERICDGYYYASAMKLFLRYFKDPEELMNPPENVISDIP